MSCCQKGSSFAAPNKLLIFSLSCGSPKADLTVTVTVTVNLTLTLTLTLTLSLTRLAKLIDGAKRKESEDEGTGAEQDGDIGRGWLETSVSTSMNLCASAETTPACCMYSRVLP